MILPLIRFLGHGLGTFIFHFAPIRKKIILQQITKAYPEKTQHEVHTLARKNYQHYALLFWEVLFFRRKKDFEKYVEVSGYEHVENALRKGQGVLLVGSHIGNFEITLRAAFLKKLELYFVVKTIRVKVLKWIVDFFRKNKYLKLIQSEHTYTKILELLKKNQAIGFVIDQHKEKRGIYVSFFNRLAATNSSIVSLAMASGASIVLGQTYRTPKGSFRISFAPFPLTRTQNQDFDLFYNTQEITCKIEEWIRIHPEQWLWGHRRWKGTYEGNQKIKPTLPYSRAAYAEYLSKSLQTDLFPGDGSHPPKSLTFSF